MNLAERGVVKKHLPADGEGREQGTGVKGGARRQGVCVCRGPGGGEGDLLRAPGVARLEGGEVGGGLEPPAVLVLPAFSEVTSSAGTQ